MTQKNQPDAQHPQPLSFEAITAEIGDVAIPVSEEPSRPTQDTSDSPDFYGTVIVDDSETPAAVPEEDLNMRVLTGSSPKPRPMWVDGLFSAVLAGLFITPVMLRIGLAQYQPWISYMAMLLALGAGLWSLLGLRQEDTSVGKRMCYVGALLSLIVLVAAFLVRAPLASH